MTSVLFMYLLCACLFVCLRVDLTLSLLYVCLSDQPVTVSQPATASSSGSTEVLLQPQNSYAFVIAMMDQVMRSSSVLSL